MKTLPFGKLPTRSFFNIVAANAVPNPAAVYSLLQRSLQKSGPNELVHDLLKVCGFTWAPLVPSELDVAVAAVADALAADVCTPPATSPPDSRHFAVEPGELADTNQETPFVAAGSDTNGDGAGGLW
jgi:hypothetical protein